MVQDTACEWRGDQEEMEWVQVRHVQQMLEGEGMRSKVPVSEPKLPLVALVRGLQRCRVLYVRSYGTARPAVRNRVNTIGPDSNHLCT
jgi:hypothetical protein